MDKARILEDFRKEVEACEKCELRNGCQRVIFGEGYSNAGIMCIGEGPGQEEDRLGRPFVGRAGQLLDKILEASGFERFTHIYIANIVKCRPPKNRVPLPQERNCCLPYLYKQIEIIDPQIIVLLGATALQGLIDSNAKISKVRGHWLMWEGKWVMPTYHPAALLRNPNLKRAVWEDFKLIIEKYRELVDSQHKSPNF